jgi:hypothetical protein
LSVGALLTVILVGWLIPETNGRSLEEITKFWTDFGKAMLARVSLMTSEPSQAESGASSQRRSRKESMKASEVVSPYNCNGHGPWPCVCDRLAL